MRAHVPDRWPFVPWSTKDTVVAVLVLISGLSAAVVAVRLGRRLRANPSGLLLAVAGLVSSAAVAATYWPSEVGVWAGPLLPYVANALLVLLVLCWPTGRLEARWRRPTTVAVVSYVASGVLVQVFGVAFADWLGRPWAFPTQLSLGSGQIVLGVGAALLTGVAPAFLIGATVRRHRSMPRPLQRPHRPVLVVASIVAGISLWGLVADLLTAPTDLMRPATGSIAAVRSYADAARVALIAWALLTADERRRHRTPRVAEAAAHIELGAGDEDVDPTAAVRHLLEDPTATVRVTSEPSAPAAAERDGGRRQIGLVDERGRILATVSYCVDREPTVAVRDALVAGLGATVWREARRREAEARTIELQALQRRLLDADDRARHRLERDLHDGVQQRLVALALQASLLARRERTRRAAAAPGPAPTLADDFERVELLAGIEDAITVTHTVVRDGRAGVVERGLAAGLAALAATIPLPTRLVTDGDVPGDHPAATALWYVASEAVANCLKHAGATLVTLDLHVAGPVVELSVGDDGIGGLTSVPPSVVHRLADLAADVRVESVVGRGSILSASVVLDRAGATV